MDIHHVIEAGGILLFGVIVYSYAHRWFARAPAVAARRAPLMGVAFGLIAVALMIARIEVRPDLAMDARHVPVALIGLFEGVPAGLIAAGMAALYRGWMGGSGAGAGIVAVLAVGLAAGLLRRWSLRRSPIGLAQSAALALIVYAITAASFLSLGATGRRLFAVEWWGLLLAHAVGIGLAGRLFVDVVERERRDALEREATTLKSVAELANAAAHEINNPLAVVVGSLDLLGRRLPPGSKEADWVRRSQEASLRIHEIVGRMRHITHLERVETPDHLPPILDIRRSSE
jgi:signal transduction histidine kinase